MVDREIPTLSKSIDQGADPDWLTVIGAAADHAVSAFLCVSLLLCSLRQNVPRPVANRYSHLNPRTPARTQAVQTPTRTRQTDRDPVASAAVYTDRRFG